jgi:polysaccharide chain length determinant protein (PEP-CTERM system associated)
MTMNDLKYYLSLFLRRLHYFLLVSVVVSAVAVIVAISLPPAYEAQTRLLMEGPQIPQELASSTVNVSTSEQLEIIQQRLMTRANLLDVARSQRVFEDIGQMSADEIVDGMRARTNIRTGGGRNSPATMTLSFEARRAAVTSGVLNEYLTMIQQESAAFRSNRAGTTLSYFQDEVTRLGEDLDAQSARILEFKTENSGALPEDADFRRNRMTSLQEEVNRIDREITSLRNQSDRLKQIFEATGQLGDGENLTEDQKRLRDLRRELDEALSLYSESNPRVTMLQARIDRLEERVETRAAQAQDAPGEETAAPTRESATLDLQLDEIETRIAALEQQRDQTQARVEELRAALEKTPANSIALDKLQRSYRNIEQQYNNAVDRLARASTGERIESGSRGARISVIEPPSTPNRPTKPNRMKIAGGGTMLGIAGGLGLVVLLEMLNRTARRPEDIINRIGVRPLATIPYVYSRGEVAGRRLIKGVVYMTILVGVPVAIYAVHMYYLPLDLLADKVMDRMGVRL